MTDPTAMTDAELIEAARRYVEVLREVDRKIYQSTMGPAVSQASLDADLVGALARRLAASRTPAPPSDAEREAAGGPDSVAAQTQYWRIVAPGDNYLHVAHVGVWEFRWTKEREKALRFVSHEDADGVMMAVRAMDQVLFGFAKTLGEAIVVMEVDRGPGQHERA